MKNKVLVELVVPKIEKSYNVYLPVSKTIGNIIVLLNQALMDLNDGALVIDDYAVLYNKATGQKYIPSQMLVETDIRNGSVIILV